MKPWLRICTSFEEEAEADREYWRQFSPTERVALIDQMRASPSKKRGRTASKAHSPSSPSSSSGKRT